MSNNDLPQANTPPPDLPSDPPSTNNAETPPLSSKHPVITGGTGENDGQSPVIRNPRGRFMAGSRANPKGRPRGGTNQATRLAQGFLEQNAPDLAKIAFDQASKGNTLALKLCMDRAIVAPQDRAVQLKLPAADATPNEILEAHSALVRAMAAGEITPAEGEIFSRVLEARRRSWEAVDLNERISTLEGRAADEAKRRRR